MIFIFIFFVNVASILGVNCCKYSEASSDRLAEILLESYKESFTQLEEEKTKKLYSGNLYNKMLDRYTQYHMNIVNKIYNNNCEIYRFGGPRLIPLKNYDKNFNIIGNESNQKSHILDAKSIREENGIKIVRYYIYKYSENFPVSDEEISEAFREFEDVDEILVMYLHNKKKSGMSFTLYIQKIE
jgi:hypothetical protein